MLAFAGVWALCNSTCLQAQVSDRNIEEIKAESLLRAQRGAYPLGGLAGPIL
jgi:hypothetical protein